jgi:hypothetical protein
MDALYVTLYTGPKSLVNCQVLSVKDATWNVRLSAALDRVETLYATFWLDPTPVNCHVRVIDAAEDPITGELQAQITPIDLNVDERRRVVAALHGLGGYVRLRAS